MKNGLLLGTLFLFFSAFNAQAELVVTDWETEGDELIVIDTDTGYKWLNLAYTAGVSIDQVSSELATTYSGWKLATYDDVLTLMRNHFEWTGNIKSTAPAELRNEWQDAFGITGSLGRSYGSYIGDNGRMYMAGTRDSNNVYTSYLRNNDTTSAFQYDGVFLVSDKLVTLEEKANIQSVNSPLAVGVLALAFIFGSRRFTNH